MYIVLVDDVTIRTKYLGGEEVPPSLGETLISYLVEYLQASLIRIRAIFMATLPKEHL